MCCILRMKGTCTLVASVVAASTVALSSSPAPAGDRDVAFYSYANEGLAGTIGTHGAPNACSSSDEEKFAPRFDGLRFIETLITAHR